MSAAILVAIFGLSFLVITCAFGIGTYFLTVIARLDTIIDLMKKERTAAERARSER